MVSYSSLFSVGVTFLRGGADTQCTLYALCTPPSCTPRTLMLTSSVWWLHIPPSSLLSGCCVPQGWSQRESSGAEMARSHAGDTHLFLQRRWPEGKEQHWFLVHFNPQFITKHERKQIYTAYPPFINRQLSNGTVWWMHLNCTWYCYLHSLSTIHKQTVVKWYCMVNASKLYTVMLSAQLIHHS